MKIRDKMRIQQKTEIYFKTIKQNFRTEKHNNQLEIQCISLTEDCTRMKR